MRDAQYIDISMRMSWAHIEGLVPIRMDISIGVDKGGFYVQRMRGRSYLLLRNAYVIFSIRGLL
jgi:hypothetical protein